MVLLDGVSLRPEDVGRVVQGEPVELSALARERMEASRTVVEHILHEGRPVYAVSTGVGKLCTVVIPAEDGRALQRNIVRSHAAGVGPVLEEDAVRAMLVLRANALASGYSGVRPIVVDTLVSMLNRRVHPVVPEQGSLGASGDLAPLAHLALVVMGEGEAFFHGERLPGGEAMRRAGIPPVALEPKEGIALINGTQFMSALGTLFLLEAERLVTVADAAGALTIEALRGTDAPFQPQLQRVRPHPGQVQTAEHLRALLSGSQRIVREGYARVQDAYSLRCIPQVHGAARDMLSFLRGVLQIEINSATDNPLVFSEDGSVLSGGNFHGQPLATALDAAAIAVASVGAMSERRIERLLNPHLSGLPAFLVQDSGLQSGYMLAQYTAAALVSENKVLCHPASVDSIPTSANQEDFVSMGAHAARKAMQVLRNVQYVVAIELLVAAQAVDLDPPGQLGRGARAVYEAVRTAVPMLREDRVLADDFWKVAERIREGSLAERVEKVLAC